MTLLTITQPKCYIVKIGLRFALFNLPDTELSLWILLGGGMESGGNNIILVTCVRECLWLMCVNIYYVVYISLRCKYTFSDC